MQRWLMGMKDSNTGFAVPEGATFFYLHIDGCGHPSFFLRVRPKDGEPITSAILIATQSWEHGPICDSCRCYLDLNPSNIISSHLLTG